MTRKGRNSPPSRVDVRRENLKSPSPKSPSHRSTYPDLQTEPDTDRKFISHDSMGNFTTNLELYWLLGSWDEIVSTSTEDLRNQSDATLSFLLKASAHLQKNQFQEAKSSLLLAVKLGCEKKRLARVLLSGLYNTIARCRLLTGDYNLAYTFFKESLSVVFLNDDTQFAARGRMNNEILNLGLSNQTRPLQQHLRSSPVTVVDSNHHYFSTKHESCPDSPDYSLLNEEYLDRIKSLLIGYEKSHYSSALIELAATMSRIANDSSPPNLQIQKLISHDRPFLITSIEGDYIPEEIRRKKAFYELPLLETLRFFHQPKGVIIDCGANIGNHTLFFAAVLDADVISIEPEPHNAVLLAVNVAINNLSKKVSQIRYALGKGAGRLKLQMNISNNYGSFSAAIDANPGRDLVQKPVPVEVPVDTIDQSFGPVLHGSILSILKLDVEGMEADVLEGAEKMIDSGRPVIAVECFRFSGLQKIETFLDKYGYFPIALTNATPTFLFVSRSNRFHMDRFIDFRRSKLFRQAFESMD